MSRSTRTVCVSARGDPAGFVQIAAGEGRSVAADGRADLRRRRIRGRASSAIRWLADGSAYVDTRAVERDAPAGETWSATTRRPARREVLVSAAELIPPRESSPLAVDDYAFSTDRSRLLIFTNSQARLARPTRGATTGCSTGPAASCSKLGGDAPPSSLMHAKFAPSRLAGRLRARQQHLRRRPRRRPDHQADQLELAPTRSTARSTGSTRKSSACATASAGAPTAKSIAYWQLDTRGVPEFPLVNNTDSLYPRITTGQVPQGRREERGLPGRRRLRQRRRDATGSTCPAIRARTTSRIWNGRGTATSSSSSSSIGTRIPFA